MGAATALSFALSNPERVKALLLAAPAFADASHENPETVTGLAEALEALGCRGYRRAAIRQMRQMRLMPERAIRYIAGFQASHEAESLALACRTVIRWTMAEEFGRLRDLRVPVCILCWPGDPLHPVALAERMAMEIPGARLVRLSSMVEPYLDPSVIGRRFSVFLAESKILR
jgi:pimeloyl-ACP methyl ester carboxylesterase